VKISCPACAAKYSIADEKVTDRLAKIRCRKCGATIVIDGKVSPPNVYAADGSSADNANVAPAAPLEAAREFSVDFGDNDQRTLSLTDVISAYNAGEINAETFLWAEGMTDWKPLGEIPEVVDALHAAASAPEAAPAPAPAAAAVSSPRAPAVTASPWDVPKEAAPKQPAIRQSDAAIARAASRKGGNRAPTADLFGSFEPGANEEEVATSAREPDLGAAGARNESSVLFSLSALTASAKPAAPATSGAKPAQAAPAATNTREDSGLIDLRALTAAAPQQAQPAAPPLMNSPLGMSPLGVSPLGVSPLGLSSPLGGVEAQASPLGPPARSSKTGLFVGIGIVVAALVIAVALILKPSDPPPAVPTAATPAQPETPTATGTDPAGDTPAVAAKPPATGTTEEGAAPDAGDDKTAAKPRATPRAGARTTPRKSGAESKAGGTPAPAEKKPLKRNPCGCAPGDLQCAMRCAAGK
jgi:predicted Zn finger-like uncharacterized protein